MQQPIGFYTMLTVIALASRLGAENVPSADFYPLKVGNKWTYIVLGSDDRFVLSAAAEEKVGDQTCIRLEARVRDTILATEHVAVVKDGIYRFKNNDQVLDPPLCICKVPAKKGDTWTADFRVEGAKASAKFETDLDEATVAAGKYKCVLVRYEVTEKGSTTRARAWFAARVGMLKQVLDFGSTKVELELEKFEPAK